jgi:hypothetical protein
MNDPKYIRTPWKHRWEEFRLRRAPLCVFASVVCALGILWNHYVGRHSTYTPSEQRQADNRHEGHAKRVIEIAPSTVPISQPPMTGMYSPPQVPNATPPKLDTHPADLFEVNFLPNAN